MRKYFNLEYLFLYKGKYKELFSFALIFEKLSLKKQKNEKKYKKIWTFRLCKFPPEI